MAIACDGEIKVQGETAAVVSDVAGWQAVTVFPRRTAQVLPGPRAPANRSMRAMRCCPRTRVWGEVRLPGAFRLTGPLTSPMAGGCEERRLPKPADVPDGKAVTASDDSGWPSARL